MRDSTNRFAHSYVIASITRLPYRIIYLQAVGSLGGGEKNAFLLNLVPKILLWGLIEVDLAIVAACLPTYAPLLQNRTLRSSVRSARSAISLRSREPENRSRREDEESSEAKACVASHARQQPSRRVD